MNSRECLVGNQKQQSAKKEKRSRKRKTKLPFFFLRNLQNFPNFKLQPILKNVSICSAIHCSNSPLYGSTQGDLRKCSDMCCFHSRKGTPTDLIDWLLDSDIHIIATHVHQGIPRWSASIVYTELQRLRNHCGFPSGDQLQCPVFTQHKFNYL